MKLRGQICYDKVLHKRLISKLCSFKINTDNWIFCLYKISRILSRQAVLNSLTVFSVLMSFVIGTNSLGSADMLLNNKQANKQLIHSLPTHHVHFPEDQADECISQISVEPDGEGRLIINIGFLKIKHQYNVHFRIRDDMGHAISVVSTQNELVKLLKATPTDDGEGHELVIDFLASREKFVEEKLMIASCANPSKVITLVFQASVLGSGQGTPTLRQGVHCMASFEDKLPVVLGMDTSIDDASDYLS